MADAPEFMTETTYVKSQRGKPRKCCECCGPIVPGQSYVLLRGSWSGDFQTFYYHVQCRAISEAQSHFLQTEAGRYQDELPAIGDMIDEAREDLAGCGKAPPYWPDGVEVSYEGLRAFVGIASDGSAAQALKEETRKDGDGSWHLPMPVAS
jgi:hypothetical protein